MSTLNAPIQRDRQAWSAERIGAFTASTNGDLMTEPRSKAAKEAGELSETAKTLIAQKATEVVKGAPIKGPLSYDMKRGMALEHAMRYLLTQYWRQVDGTSLQHNGVLMATPDGLLRNGEPGEIKNTNEVEMMRFGDEVPDGDWQALKAWSKTYAYQMDLIRRMWINPRQPDLLHRQDQGDPFERKGPRHHLRRGPARRARWPHCSVLPRDLRRERPYIRVPLA